MFETKYQEIYTEYWTRPDRWGSHSFSDADAIADQALFSCGGGNLLDVGCGMGLLVRTLLGRGVDAYGIDVASAPVAEANRSAPGRFRVGSILDLPFDDGAFETVISTDVLEHLAEVDVSRALSELHRVTRRFAFIRLATTQDRDNRWHLTVQKRDWWERCFLRAGFRRHPISQTIFAYESLERETGVCSLLFEKLPPKLRDQYPLASLKAERDLHMDMLRESGRRSDAHVARYMWAGALVRPGDVVLDVSCGLGYGSAILACASPASRILGVDNSPSAIEYATAHYGKPWYPNNEFHCTDASELSFLPDRSVDLVASMETLEHLPDPEAFLLEIHRVLKPAGRIAVSVPNDWTDDSGNDPNPHHLSVYTWKTLHAQLSKYFLLEKAYAQVAGGGMKLHSGKRSLKEVPIQAEQTEEAEWWLLAAMKDPLLGEKADYLETNFPTYDDLPECNITAFGRDYDNPWLVRAIVSVGLRCENPSLLDEIARRVIETARPGSADLGAALCVRAYRMLDGPPPARDAFDSFEKQLKNYDKKADDTPHAWRWRISLAYVTALLYLARGDRKHARRAFLRCAEMDCLKFSPLLATKTVDALFQAGRLSLCDAKTQDAGQCWRMALVETRRVLQGGWETLWGRTDSPAPFAVPEIERLLDLASRAAHGLNLMTHVEQRPGWTWHAIHENRTAELAYWKSQAAELASCASSATEGNLWLTSQRSAWETLARERESLLASEKDYQSQLIAAKRWHEEQSGKWKRTSAEHEKQIESLKVWIDTLEHSKSFLEQQRANWNAIAEERERTIKEQHAGIDELQRAKSWIEDQKANWENIAAERETLIGKQRAGIEKLETMKQSLADQRDNWEDIAEQRQHGLEESERKSEQAALDFQRAQSNLSGEIAGLEKELSSVLRFRWLPPLFTHRPSEKRKSKGSSET